MEYGGVLNDLCNCNDYFNRLLYRQIWSLKHRGIEINNNRRGQKKMWVIFIKYYLKGAIYNFKRNFYFSD